MVLVDKSFEQMLDEIGFERLIRYDILSPKKDSWAFTKVELNGEGTALIPSAKYRDSLLKCFSHDWLVGNAIKEAFLNSYQRGHNYNPSLSLSLKIAKGSKGCVIRIRDSGKGFDGNGEEFGGKAVSFLSARGKYWQRKGCGLRALNARGFEASYEGDGSVLNIKIKKLFPTYET